MGSRFLFLVLSAAALCAQAPAPTAAEVLGRAKAAMGGVAWDRVVALEYTGDLHAAGMDGTIHAVEDLRGGREVDRFDLGALKGASGRDESAAWDQEGQGDVKVDESEDARKGFATDRFQTLRAYWYPGRAQGAMTYAGEGRDGGHTFHVVRIVPKGGIPFDLWIDAAEWTFSRTVCVKDGRPQTTRFGDYRVVDGLTVPFSITTDAGDAAFQTRIRIASLKVNPVLPPGAFLRPKANLGAYGIRENAPATQVPLQFQGDHLLVQVRLNGMGPFLFFLDTGGANVVSPALAKEVGLVSQGTLQGGGVGEKDEAFGTATVARVEVGAAWMADQTFFVVPALDELKKAWGLDVSGVVGYELFRRFVAHIEGCSRLTLSLPGNLPYAGPGTTVPFLFNGTQPQVEGSLDGIPGRFDLDTGSGATLDVYSPFVKEHHLNEKASRSIHTVLGQGVGGEVWGDVIRAHELKIGGASMPNPVIGLNEVPTGKFASEGIVGNVGQGFLKRFDLVLDYSHKTVTFERNANWPEPDRFTMTGIQPYADRSGRIRQVFPHSPAEEAGLKPDDTILTVNGTVYGELPPDGLRQLSRQGPGTVLSLRIRSGAGERDVKLVLRDLL